MSHLQYYNKSCISVLLEIVINWQSRVKIYFELSLTIKLRNSSRPCELEMEIESGGQREREREEERGRERERETEREREREREREESLSESFDDFYWIASLSTDVMYLLEIFKCFLLISTQ